MSYSELKQQVYEANMALVEAGLVKLTWGNASGADRKLGVMAIKPSGVPYPVLKPDDMVVLSLEDGKIVEGKARPSSDTPTHLLLMQTFDSIGGIVHTHSTYGTIFAQALRDIPCLGTTHADNFYGAIPCTRPMRAEEIQNNYEHNTGLNIIATFKERGLDAAQMPGVVVASHAPFAWGPNTKKAVENAIVLEFTAMMALNSLALNPSVPQIGQALLDKHFLRKHGPGAYYGQVKN
jgi:L-ribulose-5-phosphate 4-epimerase